MREFEKSKNSIISNDRCLTEGIDIPALSDLEREQALTIILNNEFKQLSLAGLSNKVQSALMHYVK